MALLDVRSQGDRPWTLRSDRTCRGMLATQPSSDHEPCFERLSSLRLDVCFSKKIGEEAKLRLVVGADEEHSVEELVLMLARGLGK